jgi:hypothetical protein
LNVELPAGNSALITNNVNLKELKRAYYYLTKYVMRNYEK